MVIGLVILLLGIIVAAIGTAYSEQSYIFYGAGLVTGIVGVVIIIPAARKYAK